MDLSGWNVRVLAGGPMTTCVAADKSTITWGNANHQELGYGPEGRKTAARPYIVEPLEGLHVTSVAASAGNMLFVVAETTSGRTSSRRCPWRRPPPRSPCTPRAPATCPGRSARAGASPRGGAGAGAGAGAAGAPSGGAAEQRGAPRLLSPPPPPPPQLDKK